MTIKRFLFPKKSYAVPGWVSLGLLITRAGFAASLLTHGWAKLMNFKALAAGGFPDPIGLGSATAVCLAIFAEFLCSAAVVLGLLHRLALIPMIITMSTAFFAIHGGHIDGGETAMLYLMAFIALYITGPGRFSADAIIAKKFM